MIARVILTIVLLLGWGFLSFTNDAISPLITGPLAGSQFANSDVAYLTAHYGMRLFSVLGGLISLGFIAALAGVWWKPVRTALATMAVALAVFLPGTAHAYYSQQDYTEPYFILPNESAFFVPDVGANKDTQTAFMSEDYLREKKIAAKRFEVPHQKLSGSSWVANYYVPTGRLILLDRSPYSREWVDAHDRGTSDKKQGFPCQSKEGLDVTVGMTIGTSVHEEDSPRFLYNFGVVPPTGDRKDPNVIFTSVYYGRSLEQIMDGVVRHKVQTLVCNEVSARTMDQVNTEATKIQNDSEKLITKYLDSVGITLNFIGFADTFHFDDAVQKAINDRFIADKIGPVLSVLQAQADIKVKEGLGSGLEKHGLPASLVALPTNLLDGMASMLGSVSGAKTH